MYNHFRDLGYAPINGALPGKLSSTLTNPVSVEDDGGCGPVGPPASDYVPGTVMINQEVINDGEVEDGIQTEEDYEHSDEEDDEDNSSSGIFARLRSSAQKYGLPCGAV